MEWDIPSLAGSKAMRVNQLVYYPNVYMKAMNVETKTMHPVLLIIDHGSKIWPIDGKVNQG